MAMVVKNNLSALGALNILNQHSKALTKSMKKLSSGMRITGAEDDPSGYAISERMRAQIRGLDQSIQNAQNGASLLKTAHGSISSTVDILTTMKEKAINAANDTNTDEDRATLQKEFDQCISQIDDNALTTFNGKYLTDGSKSKKTVHLMNVLANDNLDNVDPNKKLTELTTKDGYSLNIQSTDKITVSLVNQGKTYTGTYEVGDMTMNDLLPGTWFPDMQNNHGLPIGLNWNVSRDFYGYDGQDQKVYPHTPGTPMTVTGYYNSTEPPLVPSGSEGLDCQIGTFSITVSDSQGNLKKSTNVYLDDFKEVIRAANYSEDNSLSLQVGTKANQSIKVGLTDMRAYALGLKGKDGSTLSLATRNSANAAISVLDNALQKALDEQTNIGSSLSRLEHTVNNLTVTKENTQAAESVIRDADMAKEMVEFTKRNVLMQAAQAMLSQANQNSSNVLSLLQ